MQKNANETAKETKNMFLQSASDFPESRTALSITCSDQ